MQNKRLVSNKPDFWDNIPLFVLPKSQNAFIGMALMPVF
jgi:hypothetical protein